MVPSIKYIDDEIIVIDKPAGMPSVSLKKDEEDTLASWLLKKFPAQKKLPKGELEAGLIHRLDNDTSGLIVAARTESSYKNLRRQLESGSFKKGYAALVLGKPPKSGTVTFPIAHHPEKKKKMIVCKTERDAEQLKARRAITHFKTVGIRKSSYTLLEIEIETGVRHQIRVHMASIGYPLAGDRLYQNPSQRRLDVLVKTGRHFLHADYLKFKHPKTNKIVCFKLKHKFSSTMSSPRKRGSSFQPK